MTRGDSLVRALTALGPTGEWTEMRGALLGVSFGYCEGDATSSIREESITTEGKQIGCESSLGTSRRI